MTENTKIQNILDQLSDDELAFFIEYKLKTYLPTTREEIIRYIERKRGLTQFQLSQRRTKVKPKENDSHLVCKRCGSDKMVAYNVEWHIPIMRMGAEDEFASLYERATGDSYKKTKVECFVCGNIVVNPNREQMGFFRRIWANVFGAD